MTVKQMYNVFLSETKKVPENVERLKTTAAEDIAIFRKRNIYKDVKWTRAQQKKFDAYWMEVYGKKISNKWHRLYQASSGNFCVNYIPEKMFSTKIEPALNDYNYENVLEDKYLIELISNGCDCVVPKTIICCSNGQYFDQHRMPISIEEALHELNHKHFIVKRTIGSSSGKGIVFVDDSISFNKDTIKEILNKQGDDFIVQSIIKAHPSYSVFNESSINTIRIITYITGNSFHHAPLCFRIGRSNKQVDNIHAGGLVVGVRDNGCLLPCAYELGYGDKAVRYFEHPDSKVIFEGYKLPYIRRIIKAAYQAHGQLPHIGIVSWDFTVDENGHAVLIEANIKGQSIWIPQMIHGKGPFGINTKILFSEIFK